MKAFENVLLLVVVTPHKFSPRVFRTWDPWQATHLVLS